MFYNDKVTKLRLIHRLMIDMMISTCNAVQFNRVFTNFHAGSGSFKRQTCQIGAVPREPLILQIVSNEIESFHSNRIKTG